MYKSWLSVGVIITLLHIQITSGDLSIDQKIREGNRKRKLDVRLVDGISKLEGRVEIRYNDTWGTICDDRFNRKAAAVVCHMLGYRRLRAKPYKRAAYGEGKGPIWLDDLKCHGNETSLGDCKHLPWGIHNCGHKEDVGVKCQARKKAERNRMLTLELDMVVKEGERPKLFQRNKSNRNNAVKDQSKLWMKDVFYMLEDGIDIGTEVLIRNALDEWERYSCLHFSKDVLDKHYNKIVFTVNHGDKGCASTYVGMKQGPQEIHLANDCLHRDIILHEIGHALGFYHEHNRADRDQYIKVYYENIIKGYEHQFIKLHKDEYEDFGKPYDYKSIMHYGRHFFSRNESQNLVTMETVDPEFHDVIGKVKHPSFLDYKILNAMYECSAGCSFVRCPVGGFLGKDCQCYCEGNQDNEPITLCSKEKNCQNPSINEFLFEVLDRVNETVVDMTRDTYPDNTVFNIFSTNLNCSIVSELLCDSGTWLGGMPDCPVELEIKLIDGSDDEGIIELMLNEQWRGFICDDDWDDNDATVACRMIGFEFGKARGENPSKVNESLQILLDDVKCSGSESTLSECNHNGWGKHDCDHSEVAAIKCFPYKDTQQKYVLNNIDCGKIPLKGTKRRKREVRIVGGAEAVKGMYPWQVGIQRMRGRWIHWCGGTILSSHWILTAAHCFDDLTIKHDGRNEKMNYEDFKVLIGDHDRTKEDEQEQEFHIEYVVKHWQYSKADRINHKNDIALLKIDSDSGAVFNDYVQPVCLPGENVSIDYGMKCEVSGWGKRAESGEVQNKLRSVEVPIIEDRKCEHFYNQYPIDTHRVFCAGDVNVRPDTCQGDSGGPLVCDIKDRNTVFGITSWGLGCGRQNAPGVYTKASSFVSWIRQQITLHDFVVGPTPRSDGETGKCGRDEAVCKNGECIRREYRCDGQEDCTDGSDEPENCYSNLCEPYEFQCPSGYCAMKFWRCDGEIDCEDGYDESDCLDKLPGDPCGRGEFQCKSGNQQCVPLAHQCDNEIDCQDRSDEKGCSPPIITVPPAAEIEVKHGDTFTIICEAVGVPTPLISWRLNWGHIPAGDRVITISNDGRSVLTVEDARYTDAGAYTCEAINNQGSIFAIPDALVIVRLCTAKQFKCEDSVCIDLNRRCDRMKDCEDGSDESACPCRSGEFQCVNGDCIEEARRCDGRIDCQDRSDEAGCRGSEVYEGESVTLTCPKKSKRLPVVWQGPPDFRQYTRGLTVSPDLSVDQRSRISISGDHANGYHNLHIENIRMSDSGKYRCKIGSRVIRGINVITRAKQKLGLFPYILNLATRASITANATCGEDRPEYFCKLVELVDLMPQTSHCDYCNARAVVGGLEEIGTSHPIGNAIDGSNRWWQSPSISNGLEYNYVTITLDLGLIYQVAYVFLSVANSPRPGNWILEKSLDGVNYKPWQYFAITEDDCTRIYNVSAMKGNSFIRDDEVRCTSHFSKFSPLENGEIIISLTNGRPGILVPSKTLIDFTSARFVRLRFQKVRTLTADLISSQSKDPRNIDPSVTRSYFYSVKEISIVGQCICYGHASECQIQGDSDRIACVCQHNTCGSNCEICCPLFNQKSWVHGSDSSINGYSNLNVECEACNCHGHAGSCVYNSTVDELGLSLNKNGERKGGGVCIDCTDFTTGINSEAAASVCLSVATTLPCRQCNCQESVGSTGVCMVDDSMVEEGLMPGSCICKEGFGGQICDQCAPGYDSYPHCEPCSCSMAGTVDHDTCEGRCACTENVEGVSCGSSAARYRLVDGNSFNNGRVEVYLAKQWGTVCEDYFDANAARVICKSLRLPYENAHPVTGGLYGFGTGTIWLDDVKCSGNEESLMQCNTSKPGTTSCTHKDDVGVVCTDRKVRFQ